MNSVSGYLDYIVRLLMFFCASSEHPVARSYNRMIQNIKRQSHVRINSACLISKGP